MTAKDMTDDELIARIEDTYCHTRHGGIRPEGADVTELIRRYLWLSERYAALREHLVRVHSGAEVTP
jgi:hypothetical protein